jgi:hypothetical protein
VLSDEVDPAGRNDEERLPGKMLLELVRDDRDRLCMIGPRAGDRYQRRRKVSGNSRGRNVGRLKSGWLHPGVISEKMRR